jgi:hypothetical protein
MTSTTNAFLKTFDNIGVLQAKLPFELFQSLTTSINDLPADAEPYNSNLLGHMKEEYSLNHIKEHMSDFLLAMADTWNQLHPGHVATFEEAAKNKKYGLYLDSLWVNKQKKHEFNPMHHHAGVLSFVIWVNIPYDLKEEEKYFPPVSGEVEENRINSYTSKFCFYYTDILGKIQTAVVPVDKTWQGTILMFPAALHHGVYPFYTSDDYRISVSGNIRIGVIE